MSKSERTRQFIIEKTAPVFNAKGYAGTSINDLTTITGLTKGSIYGNFENKDEVALSAFDYNFQQVVSYIRGQIASRSTVVGQLLVYPETYRHFLSFPFLQAGCPLANTATEADDTHPQLKIKVNAALETWRNSVDYLLKKGMEIGELKADIDCTKTVAVLTGLIQGAVLHAKVSGKLQYLNASMSFLENMIEELKS